MIRELLFRTETNLDFPLSPADTELPAKTLAAFGLGGAEMRGLIGKRNFLSTLYVVNGPAGRVVIRASAPETAAALGQQCSLFQQMADVVPVLRPLTTADGSFVHVGDDRAWMAYPYIDGAIFDGEPSHVREVIHSALALLVALQDCQRRSATVDRLPVIRVQPERWELFQRLLYCPNTEIVEAIGDEWVSALTSCRPFLSEVLGSLGQMDIAEDELVHYDLQHPNFVLTSRGPTVIDVEDVCFSSRRVAAAHGIFKLCRHVVFRQRDNMPWVANTLIAAVLDNESAQILNLGSRHDICRLAAWRTINDIVGILSALERGRPEYLYDLKKKIENLFEIFDLFSSGDF